MCNNWREDSPLECNSAYQKENHVRSLYPEVAIIEASKYRSYLTDGNSSEDCDEGIDNFRAMQSHDPPLQIHGVVYLMNNIDPLENQD